MKRENNITTNHKSESLETSEFIGANPEIKALKFGDMDADTNYYHYAIVDARDSLRISTLQGVVVGVSEQNAILRTISVWSSGSIDLSDVKVCKRTDEETGLVIASCNLFGSSVQLEVIKISSAAIDMGMIQISYGVVSRFD